MSRRVGVLLGVIALLLGVGEGAYRLRPAPTGFALSATTLSPSITIEVPTDPSPGASPSLSDGVPAPSHEVPSSLEPVRGVHADGQPGSTPITASPHDPHSWQRWTYSPVATDPARRPSLSARAAILVEPSTMTVLYAHNEHERRAPASTTKIMTALLALERGRLQDTVTVSRRAASIRGSSLHLRAGQHILLSDLVHGLLMRSGNDAAIAIAEHIAGTEEAFVHLMNRRARELGALNTHFRNSHGLDDHDHFSTAFDLAHLARLAMNFPTFQDIVGRREYVPPQGSGPWRNTNRLLWSLEGAEGIKTGTTGQAGNCLVAAASRDGMQLMSVVLHSGDRWRDSRQLLEWGFDHFHPVTASRSGDALVELPIPRATMPLRATTLTDLTLIVHDTEVNQLRVEASLLDISLPVRPGQTVGRVRVFVGDEVRREAPLVAADAVLPWTPLRALWQWLKPFWN